MRRVTPAPGSAPSLSGPTGSSNGSYTLSWTTITYAADYQLQEQVNGGTWNTVASGQVTSKGFSGKVNATYGYRVRGHSSGGYGPWSATHNVAVAKLPGVRTGLTA